MESARQDIVKVLKYALSYPSFGRLFYRSMCPRVTRLVPFAGSSFVCISGAVATREEAGPFQASHGKGSTIEQNESKICYVTTPNLHLRLVITATQ